MQIRETNSAAIARAYTRQASGVESSTLVGRATDRQAGGRPRTDSLVLSDTLQQVAQLRDYVAGQPDVRPHVVAEYRARLATGAYQVDTLALAQRLLGAS